MVMLDRNSRLVLATVAVVLLFFARPWPGESDRSLEQTASLAVDGSLAIDQVLVRTGKLDPARAVDGVFPFPASGSGMAGLDRDRAWRAGHYYPGTAPGMTFVLLPGYVAYHAIRDAIARTTGFTWADDDASVLVLWLTVLVMIPISVLTIVVVHTTHRALLGDAGLARNVTLLYAFGTAFFYYGTVLNPWQAINAVTWVCIYRLAVRFETVTLVSAAVCGTLAGLASSLNYLGVCVIGVFGVWLAVRDRRRAAAMFVLGASFGVLPTLIYHTIVFGHPLSTAYGHRIDAGAVEILRRGLLGFEALPSPWIALKLLVSPTTGFFVYMPVMLVALWARPVESRRALYYLGLGGGVLFLLFNAARHHDWWGGEGFFGPRYLIPALPFVWLLVLEGFRRAGIRTFSALAFLSLFINWVGAQYGDKWLHLALGQFVVRGPHFPVLDFVRAILDNYTTRRPPMSAMGLMMVLGVCLVLLWWRDKPHIFRRNTPPSTTQRHSLLPSLSMRRCVGETAPSASASSTPTVQR